MKDRPDVAPTAPPLSPSRTSPRLTDTFKTRLCGKLLAHKLVATLSPPLRSAHTHTYTHARTHKRAREPAEKEGMITRVPPSPRAKPSFTRLAFLLSLPSLALAAACTSYCCPRFSHLPHSPLNPPSLLSHPPAAALALHSLKRVLGGGIPPPLPSPFPRSLHTPPSSSAARQPLRPAFPSPQPPPLPPHPHPIVSVPLLDSRSPASLPRSFSSPPFVFRLSVLASSDRVFFRFLLCLL